jgi:O-antigen ligase
VAVSETVSLRAAQVREEVRPGALLFAAAIPILFLHIQYEPGVRVPLGSTHLGLELSDLAAVVVGAAGLWAGFRVGFDRLRPAVPLWIASAALLLWILIRTQTLTHFVTAAKFSEYALLAVAAPLLLRRRSDYELVAAVIAAWSVVATFVGTLQFLGVDIAGAWPAGRRQPSFLGHFDFAALSGLALGIGLAALIIGRRRIGWIPVVSGVLGLVIAGAVAGLGGIGLAGVALLYAAHRRGALDARAVALVVGSVAITAIGILSLRAGDLEQFLRFTGVKQEEKSTTSNVQTYSHHTLLAYIGYRIWLRHPVAGAGWQASGEEPAYGPVLPAAHRRFPDVAPLSFPAPGREYGVQNGYVQVLADLGVIGLVLWLAPFAIAIVLALRADVPPGAVAAFAVLTAMGIWAAQGLVAGLPLDALTWIAFGFAATAAANARAEAAPASARE